MDGIPAENQRFKGWMERSGRSAGAVARDLGVSRAVLSHILTGRNKLSLSVVQHAARVYPDFDLAYVVLGTDPGLGKREEPTAPVKVVVAKKSSIPRKPSSLHGAGYDQLILVRDGKFQVLEPEDAEL
ncbi:MAG: helix-turn-helix domain-containing protein [Bacteroidota bacterium]